MTKRKMGDIILYNDAGEVVHASVYRNVKDTSTFDGRSEHLGIPEVIAENGEHINVRGEGDDMQFETLSGTKLYMHPPEKD